MIARGEGIDGGCGGLLGLEDTWGCGFGGGGSAEAGGDFDIEWEVVGTYVGA